MPGLSQQEIKALRTGAQPVVSREVLVRLLAELKLRLRQPDTKAFEYFEEAVAALRALRTPENADLRIQCLLDSCQFFYLFGKVFNAIDPAREAIALARGMSDQALLRRALNTLGILYADTGNCSSAIECYAEALEVSRLLKDADAECTSWINLGVVLIYLAQYQEALACLERAVSIAEGNPSLHHLQLKAYANIAMCALHTEDYGRGLRAAEASVQSSSEPVGSGEMLSRVLREQTFTRLLLEVSSIEKARERCEIMRRYANASNSPRAEIVAALAEGLCEVHGGRIDVGLSRLTSTLEKARMISATHREALVAMVRAYELIGQPDRALVYLHELMEHTKKQQQENALRHLQLHMQQLAASSPDQQIQPPALRRREAVLKGQVAEQELFRSRIEMLERLAVTAELRDDSTGEHSYRVGRLASLLAQEYGCDDGTVLMVDIAARLHDVGKIGVPDAILLKPDKLNEAERQIMRQHTVVGAELLSKSNIPHMQMAEEIARHHHEWWDGSGYPGRLSGTAIPLAARITALADVFDALTHRRPYKKAWPIGEALQEIASLKGKQFEPELCDLFIALMTRLQRDYPDLDVYLGQAAQASPFLQARSKIWTSLRRSRDQDGSGSDSRLDLQR
jgi:putative two-component system response regulator